VVTEEEAMNSISLITIALVVSLLVAPLGLAILDGADRAIDGLTDNLARLSRAVYCANPLHWTMEGLVSSNRSCLCLAMYPPRCIGVTRPLLSMAPERPLTAQVEL
jgi:hypothetical protein